MNYRVKIEEDSKDYKFIHLKNVIFYADNLHNYLNTFMKIFLKTVLQIYVSLSSNSIEFHSFGNNQFTKIKNMDIYNSTCPDKG